jgi:hypothetical protein
MDLILVKNLPLYKDFTNNTIDNEDNDNMYYKVLGSTL